MGNGHLFRWLARERIPESFRCSPLHSTTASIELRQRLIPVSNDVDDSKTLTGITASAADAVAQTHLKLGITKRSIEALVRTIGLSARAVPKIGQRYLLLSSFCKQDIFMEARYLFYHQNR